MAHRFLKQPIFEDDHILVINKPPGMLSVPDRFDEHKENVKSWLEKTNRKVFPVHRLDEETSGVMIFAKEADSHAQLNTDFEQKNVEKVYWALTSYSNKESGRIEEPIGAHPYKKNTYVIDQSGKPSQTDYKILQLLGPYALVEARPLTGRTHQIRVHLRHIGLPLFVDEKYGSSRAFYLSSIKTLSKRPDVERPLISRSSLHAWSIRFKHPASGKEMYFEAPLPKDFKASLYQLRKRFGGG